MRKLLASGFWLLNIGFLAEAQASSPRLDAGSDRPSPALISAVQQHNGLDRTGAVTLLERQSRSLQIYPAIKDFLDPSTYAGAWIERGSGELIVATTDPGSTGAIELTGSHSIVVPYSLEELRALREMVTLDLRSSLQTEQPVSIRVDYQNNRLVFGFTEHALFSAKRILKPWQDSGFPVVLVRDDEQAQFLGGGYYPYVKGGDGYDRVAPPGLDCTVGFIVQSGLTSGFLTAAHCGWPNMSVTHAGGGSLGQFAGSTFPPEITIIPPDDDHPDGQVRVAENEDQAWVSLSGFWSPVGIVSSPLPGGIEAHMQGPSDPPVGYFVCRFGRTSGGPFCGPILAEGVQRSIPSSFVGQEVPVIDLIEAMICADFSDSGGPLTVLKSNGPHIAWAVGTLTGGSGGGGCPNSNALTWYAPVSSALSRFGLSLKTSAPPQPPPPILWSLPEIHCDQRVLRDDGRVAYFCEIQGGGQNLYGTTWTDHWGRKTRASVMLGSCRRGEEVRLKIEMDEGADVYSIDYGFRCRA